MFKSGELINGFFGLEDDFDRLTLSQVVVELLDRSIEDEEPQPRLFELLTTTLSQLSHRETSAAGAYWFFHTHLLRELGFRPHAGHCVICNEPLDAGGSLGLGSPHLECVKCHQPGQDSIFLTVPTLEVIQKILTAQKGESPSYKLKASDRRNLWDFLWRYTFYHIESTRGMRSLKVLRQLYG